MWVADHNAPTITSLVESILKLYQQASFQVTEVCTNREFKPELQVLQDDGWSFMTNLANAQEHVPEVEHNNHILKEHIHTTYHGIPCKMLPQTVICYMVMVPKTTIMTNNDDDLDTESDHNSVDPNNADNNSSIPSVHSTGSHIPIHSTTSEPPHHPLDEKELDDIELPELEAEVPVLHCSKRVSVPPSNYIPQMGGKMYIMNVQTKTNQDEEKGLVYNHDEAKVLATVITTFNKCMEHVVKEQGQQHVVTYSLKAGINGDQAKASEHKDMKQLHDRSCFRPVHQCSLNKSERHRAMESLLFLTEKRDKMIKSQHCADGSTQCTYMECDKVTSPTVSTEGNH